MRRTDSPEATFSARIPGPHKAALIAIFPMMGGQKWTMETALEKFLERCDRDPALVVRVHRMIEENNASDPPRGLEQIMPRVKADLHERFITTFHEQGATTWFIRTFVATLVTQYEKEMLPEDHVAQAIDEMLSRDI